MKRKNLLITYVVELFIFVVCIIVLSVSGIGFLPVLVDFPTLLLFILFTVPVLAGSGLWKDLFRVFSADKGSLIKLNRTLEAVKLMQRQVLFAGCIIITLSALILLYTAPENEQAFSPLNLFIAILPAIYMAVFELLLMPMYTETKLAILDYMGKEE